MLPAPDAYINLFAGDDGASKDLKAELLLLYKALGRLPERDYLLSSDAKQIFQDYHNNLTQWCRKEDHPGLAATYPKLQTYLGRFALWLHLVNSALAGRTPAAAVDGRTMAAAVEIVDFYMKQAKLLYAVNGEETSLAGNLLKIQEYVNRHPEGVTARQIKYGVWDLRSTPMAEVKKDCDTLVRSKLVNEVSKVYYPSKDANDEEMMRMMRTPHHTEPLDIQEFQDQPHQNAEVLTTQGLEHDEDSSSLLITSHQSSSPDLVEKDVKKFAPGDKVRYVGTRYGKSLDGMDLEFLGIIEGSPNWATCKRPNGYPVDCRLDELEEVKAVEAVEVFNDF
jgi:hypothetical protein